MHGLRTHPSNLEEIASDKRVTKYTAKNELPRVSELQALRSRREAWNPSSRLPFSINDADRII